MQFQRGSRVRRFAMLAAIFVPAAIAGAYLDWLWWPPYVGISLTIGAIALLLVAGLLALIGRIARTRIARVGAQTFLVIAVGLLAGQTLGPSREPLVQLLDGTMTLRLVSPVAAVATGPASCTNVASGTEFAVTGDPNMRLETPDRPFISVYLNVGDRWEAIEDAPRKDGVRFELGMTGQLVSSGGKPMTTTLVAVPSSTLVSTFSNAGGAIRFADLVPQGSPAAATRDAVAGTLEWTCGTP